ncbi:gluconokinase [Roseibium sp. TrichSKD4]|uniref:gluconokinase n=1 Tax=Roseibium sp. TrichSKD4 TaxID=744980 RepID=UPI000590DB19|nr:gluconokinase [Roseibium sp. TrichSKD4]
MKKYVIMGVAGCGKSTIGAALSAATGLHYRDGDDLHPEENVRKMSSGIPLNDEDRAPWLALVGQELAHAEDGYMVGCSALKRKYRDQIRTAAREEIAFLHLSGARAVITERMSERTRHFMPTSLIDSQFAALEPLDVDEQGTVIDINQPIEAIVDTLSAYIKGHGS